MSFDFNDLTFFFGAGASVPFDIPTMKELTKRFGDLLSVEGSEQERVVYDRIVTALRAEVGLDKVDIEGVFSVIEGLQHYDSENLGYLALFTSKSFLNTSLLNIAESESFPRFEILDQLKSRLRSFLSTQTILRFSRRTRLKEIYSDFFRKIGFASGSYQSGYSDVPHGQHWTLFTTNYDRCLEVFWRELAIPRATLETGFRPSGNSNVLTSSSFLKTGESFQLVKLHGSANWLRRLDTGQTEEKEFNLIQAQGLELPYQQDIMIYPVSQKELYVEPWIQMFQALNNVLANKTKWIVVGYSFRDSVIRNIFRINLKQNKRMLVIHPHPDEIKAFFDDFEVKPILFPRYFGQDNFEQVNQEIADIVKGN